jgi:archaemetzincin
MKLLPVFAALIMTVSCGKPAPPPAPRPPAAAPDGFSFQDPPRPGDWRSHFDEPAQSVEDYRARCANRRTAERGVFVLQPMGDGLDGETLRRMRDYAEAYFGIPARLAAPMPIFEEAWHPQREQYNASMIISRLADRVPPDALVYAAIVSADLFSPRLNFVFGQGSLKNRCGVYSLHRYASPDPKLFLRRALKLMSHEAGHILSIEHCLHFKCVMQGANTLEEDDRHPMHLCPVDLAKLCWNTGADPAARTRKLRDFFDREGLEAEAAWTAARLDSASPGGHNVR